MKTKLYLYFCAMGIIAILFDPVKSFAQCNCGSGDPATPLSYYVKIDTTDAPTTIISFPKFDPDMGTLTCVVLNDTLSLISNSIVDNKASVDVTYKFLLSVSNDIAGPGISINETATRNYGPTLLLAKGNHPGDSTTYGPDTLFQGSFHQTNSSSVGGYLGNSGTVDFVYTVNGGLISQQGGISYGYQILSNYWGGFRLTYYWCPNAILASNIKNFLTNYSNERVNVQWQSQNQVAGNTYEIQVSNDGKNFTTVYMQTAQAEEGGTGNYSYQYLLSKSDGGTALYFRIKETTREGKTTYSAINTVSLSGQANQMDVYPNPATNKISLQFEKEVTGDFLVDIVSLTGQRVFTRSVTLARTRFSQLELPNPPSPGMYYVRATDKRTGVIYVNKLIMKAP